MLNMSNSSESAPVRRRVVFHGYVQGVGFRATAASIAHAYSVFGYVKNLPDGTVELVAEGESGEVQRFLAEIEDAFRSQISRTEVGDAPSADRFQRFSIRY
jgi:acylphosphatase